LVAALTIIGLLSINGVRMERLPTADMSGLSIAAILFALDAAKGVLLHRLKIA
jgi:hypothetical protein